MLSHLSASSAGMMLVCYRPQSEHYARVGLIREMRYSCTSQTRSTNSPTPIPSYTARIDGDFTFSSLKLVRSSGGEYIVNKGLCEIFIEGVILGANVRRCPQFTTNGRCLLPDSSAGCWCQKHSSAHGGRVRDCDSNIFHRAFAFHRHGTLALLFIN